MVGKFPKDRVVGQLPNGHSWLINGVYFNHILTWEILKVVASFIQRMFQVLLKSGICST